MENEGQASRIEFKIALVLIALQLALHFFVLEGLRNGRDQLASRAGDAPKDAAFSLRAEASAWQETIDGLANLAIALSVGALVLLIGGWVRNRTSWRAREAQWVQGVIDTGANVRGNFTARLKRSWAVQTAVEKWSVVGVLVAVVQLVDGLGRRYF